MRKKLKLFLIITTAIFSTAAIFCFKDDRSNNDQKFLSYIVDCKKQDLQFYWKDEHSNVFGSIGNLKEWVEKKHQNLLFAMNGGMYKTDSSPLGLFIQKKNIVTPINTSSGNGNFYLMPNGVFYITENKEAGVCKTTDFGNKDHIQFATQSGPMLVIDGVIHPDFKEGSSNLNTRNGVGILPGNKIVFAMSKEAVNFYDFAKYFKDLGCMNALYLDGFVSRTYLPGKNWIQTDGNFGVIIAVTQAK